MSEMSRLGKFFVNRRGTRSFERLLKQVRNEASFSISPGARVLELGAGNSMFSQVLFEAYHPAEIHVTDYDLSQVEVAKSHLRKRYGTIPPAFFTEQADATHLSYPDRTFDLVTAHLMLHHLGDSSAIRRGILEVFRVLRPGGRFLYVEMFHREMVRDAVLGSGLKVAYSGKTAGMFHSRDIVIAVRPEGT